MEVTVAGYERCSCGSFVVREMAEVSGGLCGECLKGRLADTKRQLTVLVGGRIAELSPRPRNTRQNALKAAKRAQNPDWKRRHTLRHRARRRAMKRLAALHPDEMAILTAIERESLGLDAWPASLVAEALRAGVHIDPGEPPIAVLYALRAYHARPDGRERDDTAPTEGLDH
jgi:hypothetical protein